MHTYLLYKTAPSQTRLGSASLFSCVIFTVSTVFDGRSSGDEREMFDANG